MIVRFVCGALLATFLFGASPAFSQSPEAVAIERLVQYDTAKARGDLVHSASLAESLLPLVDAIDLLTPAEQGDLYSDLSRTLVSNGATSSSVSAMTAAVDAFEVNLRTLIDQSATSVEISGARFKLFEALSTLEALIEKAKDEPSQDNIDEAYSRYLQPGRKRRTGRMALQFGYTLEGEKILSPLGGGTEQATFETIDLFYGTNRSVSGDGPRGTHSNDRGQLSFGRMKVTVPRDRSPGSIPRPGLLDPRGARDGVHIVIKSLSRLEGAGFDGQLNTALEGEETRARDMFIFVHGHAVTFDAAARQAAQLAVDLDMRAGASFYSWPNGESVAAYQVSQNNVGVSSRHFTRYLQAVLEEAGDTNIHIVAHSMGNRLLLEALERLSYAQEPGDAPLFGELVWASPDVDAEYFSEVLAELPQMAEGMTAYTSSKDRALQLSQSLGGSYPRAGQSQPLPQIAELLTAVDTSNVSRGIGHSDFTGGAINDLRAVVWLGLPPEDRCILSRETLEESLQFWRATEQTPACDEDAFRRAISAMRLYADGARERVDGVIETLEQSNQDPDLLSSWRRAAEILVEISP